MAAIGDKMIARMGMLISVLKAKASRKMDIAPANCDQNKDLKEPICFEKTPPRKSYIPHPNMPAIPNNMLMMVEFIPTVGSRAQQLSLEDNQPNAPGARHGTPRMALSCWISIRSVHRSFRSIIIFAGW